MTFLLIMEGDGDEDKFLQLYEAFKHRMFYIASGILGDKKLAEDAVQESLLAGKTRLKVIHYHLIKRLPFPVVHINYTVRLLRKTKAIPMKCRAPINITA